jgi:hypothetical protein
VSGSDQAAGLAGQWPEVGLAAEVGFGWLWVRLGGGGGGSGELREMGERENFCT